MFPPGRARLCTNPCSTGSVMLTKMIGMVPVSCLSAAVVGVERPIRTSGRSPTSSFAKVWASSISLPGQPELDVDIPSLGPAKLRETLPECHHLGRAAGILRYDVHQHADV